MERLKDIFIAILVIAMCYFALYGIFKLEQKWSEEEYYDETYICEVGEESDIEVHYFKFDDSGWRYYIGEYEDRVLITGNSEIICIEKEE